MPSARVHIVDDGHGSLDPAANEIAARVRKFMDIPKESNPREEIMAASNDAGEETPVVNALVFTDSIPLA